MATPPARATAAAVSLGFVLAATFTTLLLGAAVKAPCATGDWADGRQYRRLCYSDVVPLYGTEHLQGSRLPYLNACPQSADDHCDEYPPLTMYVMRVAAWIGRGYGEFFSVNAVLLSACAFITSWALYRMAGARALYFAAAPTLLIYAFVNWDLVAVALATGGTLAYLRRKHGLSGVLLGLGAAAKVYPALLVIPFVWGRLREEDRRGAAEIAGWSLAAYAGANVVFAVLAFHPWSTFFRLNSGRPADWDSLWFVACTRLSRDTACGWSSGLLNFLSLMLFFGLATVLWVARLRRDPDFPRWTFAFPLLVLFLLTNKVYSPQYGLWLLPWFALALPRPWRLGSFVAFELADVMVFVTRFTWFGRLAADAGDTAFIGFRGATLAAFQLTLVLRAAVLVVCLVGWVLGRAEEPEPLPVAAARRGLSPAPA